MLSKEGASFNLDHLLIFESGYNIKKSKPFFKFAGLLKQIFHQLFNFSTIYKYLLTNFQIQVQGFSFKNSFKIIFLKLFLFSVLSFEIFSKKIFQTKFISTIFILLIQIKFIPSTFPSYKYFHPFYYMLLQVVYLMYANQVNL